LTALMSSKQKRPFRYLHREWPVEWPAIVTNFCDDSRYVSSAIDEERHYNILGRPHWVRLRLYNSVASVVCEVMYCGQTVRPRA